MNSKSTPPILLSAISGVALAAMAFAAYRISERRLADTGLSAQPPPSAEKTVSTTHSQQSRLAATPTQRSAPEHNSIGAQSVSLVMRGRLQRRGEIDDLRANSPDALAFVRKLLGSAKRGDVEAQAAIADELESCHDWETSKRKGKTWRDFLKDPAWYPQHRASIERALAFCDPLEAASEDEVGTYASWKVQASSGGDGMTLLEQSSFSDGRSFDDQMRDFHAAIATGDPKVLRRILWSYAYVSNGLSWSSVSSGDMLHQMQVFNAVADLADCDLGQDCSADVLKANCGSEYPRYGCSPAVDLYEYYQAHLSVMEYAYVSDYAQTVTQEFLSGTTDWPEAKAYQQWLAKQQ